MADNNKPSFTLPNPDTGLDPISKMLTTFNTKGLNTDNTFQMQSFGVEQDSELPSLSRVDLSKFDRLQRPFLTGNEQTDQMRMYDQLVASQSGLEYAVKGLGNVASTVIQEIVKIPGYAGGLLWDLGEGIAGKGFNIDTLLDNKWNNGIDSAREYLDENVLKMYTDKRYGESSLLEQISSPYFWAKEGADGVGFLLSMLAPGQILKAAGIGAKIAGTTAKVAGALDRVEDVGKVGRILLKGARKATAITDYGKLASRAERTSAIVVNTLIESAAEGSNAFDNTYKKAKQEGKSEEEARAIAAQVGTNVLKFNLPVLLMSNFVLENYVLNRFSKLGTGARTVGNRSAMSRITDKVIKGSDELKKAGVKDYLKAAPMKLGIGIAQEGFFEEGLQTTLEQVFSSNPELDGLDAMGEIYKKYYENLSGVFGENKEAIDFGKSVFLGGLLGGGMSMIGGVSDIKNENRALFGTSDYTPNKFSKFLGYKERKAQKGLIEVFTDSYKQSIKSAKELFNVDEAGNFIGLKEGVLDRLKENAGDEMLTAYYHDILTEVGGDVKKANELFQEKMKKHSDGKLSFEALTKWMSDAYQGLSNKEVLERAKLDGDLKYFLPFLQQEGGFEVLKEHIDSIIEGHALRYKENTGVDMTEEQKGNFKKELTDRADMFKRVYDKVTAEHNPYTLQIDPFKSDKELDSKEIADRRAKYSEFFHRAGIQKMADLVHAAHSQERADALKTSISELSAENERLRSEAVAKLEAETPADKKDTEEFKKRKEALENTSRMFLPKDKQVDLQKANEDLDNHNNILETSTNSYLDRISTKKLQEIWNKWYEGNRDEAASSREDELKETVTNEEKVANFLQGLEKAGYVLNEVGGKKQIPAKTGILVDIDGKEFYLTRQADGNYYIRDTKADKAKAGSVTKVGSLEEFLNKYKNIKIITKEEIVKRRHDLKLKEVRDKLVRERTAKEQALLDVLMQRRKQLDARNRQIDEAKKQQDEFKQMLIDLYKEVSEGKLTRSEAKQLRNELLAEIDNSQALIDSLEEEKRIIEVHIGEINEWRNLLKEYDQFSFTKMRSTMSQEIDLLFEELKENFLPESDIPGLERQREEITTVIGELVDNIARLRRMEDLLIVMESDDDVIRTMELVRERESWFLEKWTYVDKAGKIHHLPENPRKDKDEFIATLENISRERGVSRNELIKDLKKDIKLLTKVRSEYELTVDERRARANELATTQANIAELQTQLKDYQKQLEMVNLYEKLYVLDRNLESMGKHYAVRLANLKMAGISGEEIINKTEQLPENPFDINIKDKDAFYPGRLPNELLHTTGISIEFNPLTGEDILITDDDGNQRRVANLSKYQQAWFNFTDKFKSNDNQKYRLKLVRADYNATDPINKALAENNRTNRTDNDVFAIAVDAKTGVPLYGDKFGNVGAGETLLFTSIRRPDSLFPTGKLPRINRHSLMNMYFHETFQTLVNRDWYDPDKNINKKLKEVFSKPLLDKIGKTLSINDNTTFEDILGDASAWGLAKYQTFYNSIGTSKEAVFADISGVTNGIPTSVIEKDSVKKFNPLQSLKNYGVSIDEFGRPVGFDMQVVSHSGYVVVNGVRKYGYVPGTVLMHVHSTGQIVPMISESLQDEEINTILSILDFAGKNPDKGYDLFVQDFGSEWKGSFTFLENKGRRKVGTTPGSEKFRLFPRAKDRFSVLTLLFNYGKKERNSLSKGDIFIGHGNVYFGQGGVLALSDVNDKTKNKALVDFLKTKRLHVNQKLLTQIQSKSTKSDKFKGIAFHYPQVKGKKLFFKKYDSYLHFLFNEGKLTTTVPDGSYTQKHGIPQFSQRNVNFVVSRTAAPITKPQVRNKAVAKPATVLKYQNVFEQLESAKDLNFLETTIKDMLAGFTEVEQDAKLPILNAEGKPVVIKGVTMTKEVSIEMLKELDAYIKNKKEPAPAPEAPATKPAASSFKVSTDITPLTVEIDGKEVIFATAFEVTGIPVSGKVYTIERDTGDEVLYSAIVLGENNKVLFYNKKAYDTMQLAINAIPTESTPVPNMNAQKTVEQFVDKAAAIFKLSHNQIKKKFAIPDEIKDEDLERILTDISEAVAMKALENIGITSEEIAGVSDEALQGVADSVVNMLNSVDDILGENATSEFSNKKKMNIRQKAAEETLDEKIANNEIEQDC
jgi:hypothetical protein